LKRRLLTFASFGEPPSFKPQKNCGHAQDKIKQGDPYVGVNPEYFTFGGLALCFGLNLFGGWLNLYDNRRPQFTRRRMIGVGLSIFGVVAGLCGYYLAAANGGGY
jgi:hypothetical protein